MAVLYFGNLLDSGKSAEPAGLAGSQLMAPLLGTSFKTLITVIMS